MKNSLLFRLFCVSACSMWFAVQAAAAASPRERLSLDANWRFHLGDIPAVLEELRAAGFGEHEFTRRLLRRWAEADGPAAAAWAEQNYRRERCARAR